MKDKISVFNHISIYDIRDILQSISCFKLIYAKVAKGALGTWSLMTFDPDNRLQLRELAS